MSKPCACLLIAGIAALPLAACDLYGTEPTRTATASLAPADAGEAAKTCEVLSVRLRQHAPHMNSVFTCEAHGADLALTFEHGAPADDTINYLAKTQGKLAIYLYGHPDQPWITDADIVDAASAIDGDGNRSLNIHVSNEAGRRLLTLTAAHTGQVLEWSLDGNVMVRAAIRGPFSVAFQLSTPDGSHNLLLATVLKSGRLPARVVAVSLQQKP